jgi:hypothetical protein
MKSITFTLLLTLFFFNARSQSTLYATFDCVINDSIVQVADVENCKKLILIGTDSEKSKIISGLVSVTSKSGLKEFNYKEGSANSGLIAAINDLAGGDLSKYNKVYIENVIVEVTKDGKPPIRKKLPTSQVIVKK